MPEISRSPRRAAQTEEWGPSAGPIRLRDVTSSRAPRLRTTTIWPNAAWRILRTYTPAEGSSHAAAMAFPRTARLPSRAAHCRQAMSEECDITGFPTGPVGPLLSASIRPHGGERHAKLSYRLVVDTPVGTNSIDRQYGRSDFVTFTEIVDGLRASRHAKIVDDYEAAIRKLVIKRIQCLHC